MPQADAVVVVGLGNPGGEYAHTRHNIGFMVVDAIHERHGFAPWRLRYEGLVSEGILDGTKCYLVKPQTFMNLSGTCVQPLLQFYKIPISDVIVIHDELDLDVGEMRMKQGGGDAGHNGLKSISRALGGTYHRLRIGIGHPRRLNLPIDVSDYVLGKITADEQKIIVPIIEKIVEHVGDICVLKKLIA